MMARPHFSVARRLQYCMKIFLFILKQDFDLRIPAYFCFSFRRFTSTFIAPIVIKILRYKFYSMIIKLTRSPWSTGTGTVCAICHTTRPTIRHTPRPTICHTPRPTGKPKSCEQREQISKKICFDTTCNDGIPVGCLCVYVHACSLRGRFVYYCDYTLITIGFLN